MDTENSDMDDINSINPRSWMNIPEPVSKAVEIIIQSINHQKNYIEKFDMESIKNIIIDCVLERLRKNESKIEKILSEKISEGLKLAHDKCAIELSTLKNKITENYEDLDKDLQEIKQKIIYSNKMQLNEISGIKDSIQITKDNIKTEIFNQHIKPDISRLDNEISEYNKNLHAIEKSFTSLNKKLDSSIEKVYLRLLAYREDLKNLEKFNGSIFENLDKVLKKKTDEFFSIVKEHESQIEKSFYNLQELKTKAIDEIQYERTLFSNNFKKKTQKIKSYTGNTKSLLNQASDTQKEIIKKFEKLEESVNFDIERLKIDMENYTLNCYKDAKENLIKSYREDIVALKQKLDWLPDNLHEISDMSSIEARVFTLESRLRHEETNRIFQKMDIIKGNNQTELENKCSSTSHKNRSITPTSVGEYRPKIKFLNNFKSIDRPRHRLVERSLAIISPGLLKNN